MTRARIGKPPGCRWAAYCQGLLRVHGKKAQSHPQERGRCRPPSHPRPVVIVASCAAGTLGAGGAPAGKTEMQVPEAGGVSGLEMTSVAFRDTGGQGTEGTSPTIVSHTKGPYKHCSSQEYTHQ